MTETPVNPEAKTGNLRRGVHSSVMSAPTQIGRYHIVGHLAAGGMAEILLGKLFGPSGFERAVVIKRILPNFASSQTFVDMFLDEARVVARIQHPNVVQVQELGQTDGALFMVMEYLEGETLQGILRRIWRTGYRLPSWLVAHVIAQVCAGLHAAHDLTDDMGQPLGLVHRDVSPSNIFITYNGAVKLLDFGIAKFEARKTGTEAGQLKGKFAYMAPELCLAQPLDRRTDIFSLGVVFFEALTGRRLFARDNHMLSMKAITEDPIPSVRSVAPECPKELVDICARALSRDPADRYATAAEMRRELLLAVRQYAANELPEDALRSFMLEHFRERVTEKRDMLRRVMAGSEITKMPGAEVEQSVQLPVADVVPTSPTSIWSPRRAPRFALAGIALVGAAALGGWFAQSNSPPATHEVVDRAPPALEPSEPAEPPPAAQAVTADAQTVSITVQTSVPGAEVTLEGEPQGQTPVTLELPRSDAPVELRLTRTGFEPLTHTITPTRDLEMLLSQSPVRRSRSSMRSTSGRPPAEPTSQMASPFRRFN